MVTSCVQGGIAGAVPAFLLEAKKREKQHNGPFSLFFGN
jgi:hypothetical protein